MRGAGLNSTAAVVKINQTDSVIPIEALFYALMISIGIKQMAGLSEAK
jgi:hypothetical protein